MFAHLANHWVESGVPVDLVVARQGGATLHRLDPRVRLISLNAGRTATAIPALARYLRLERPSILISAIEHANIVAWLARGVARTPVPLLCSAHNHIGQIVRSPFLKQRIMGSLLARAYRGADGVIAVSGAVADDVALATGVNRNGIRVLPNPLDVDRVTRLASARRVEPPARPWFVGVGRLELVKDFATLIRAFSRVYAQRGGHLTILGEGSQRQNLVQLIRQMGLLTSISLPGYKANPYPWMSNADAVVVSSAREGFGMVISEALALGTQVVSTRAGGGPEEILDYGRFGHLAETGSVDSLYGAMQSALDSPIPHRQVLARAKVYAAGRISEEYIAVLKEHSINCSW